MNKQLPIPGIPAKLRPRPSAQKGYKRQDREHVEQTELFNWIRYWESRVVGLSCVYAIPNGIYAPPKAKQKAIDEGLRQGVWDIFISAPRDCTDDCCTLTKAKGFRPPLRHPGAYIEMKNKGEGLTPEQILFRERLQPYNFRWFICYSWDSAARAIYHHLQLNDPDMWEQIKPMGEAK
jgi:hypothetical protein